MSHEPSPILREITVPLSKEAAFHRFVYDIDTWWPLEHFSILGPVSRSCVIEAKKGGDIYEIGVDGDVVLWGSVTEIDPPNRFSCTWHPGRPPQTAQELHLTFRSDRGDEQTNVKLKHSGWDKLGDNALEVHSLYDQGWDTVFVEGYGRIPEKG
jgi:uncharacterized protein YndB with AHSA1/START domain